MKECEACELAVYCYSDSSTWIFRTLQEMSDTREAIARCPRHPEVEAMRSATAEKPSEAQA